MQVRFHYMRSDGMPGESEWPMDAPPAPGDLVDLTAWGRNEMRGVVTHRAWRANTATDQPIWHVYLGPGGDG